MAYSDYLRDFSRRFTSKFDGIAAHYNMELGDEFEIAVCEALRVVLPGRFGICRGFIVNDAGAKSGDDIIVFDRESYPTLRLLPQDSFGRLEDIPAEAVCAYFEAKHTLYSEASKSQAHKGTPPNLQTALGQIAAAKSIDRAGVPLGFGGTFTQLKDYNGIKLTERNPQMPGRLNPLFVGIISRFAKKSEDDEAEPSVGEFAAAFSERAGNARPDLIIAGQNLIAFPVIPPAGGEARASFASPFFVEGQSALTFHHVDSLAWGVGIALLLDALRLIQLGKVTWGAVAVDAVTRFGTKGMTIVTLD